MGLCPSKSFLSRVALLFLALVLACLSLADQTVWVSFQLKGEKIGFAMFREVAKGQGTTERRSEQRFQTKLMGQQLEIEAKSTSLLGADGQLKELDSTLKSGGRETRVTARREGGELVVRVHGEGRSTRLPLPAGGFLADDPTADLFFGRFPPSKSLVFDSQNLVLVPNEVRLAGTAEVVGPSGVVRARRVEVIDPRFPATFYLSTKGDVIRADGPFGIEMIPVSEPEATEGLSFASDLATASMILVGDFGDEIAGARASHWRVTEAKISVANDSHQVFKGDELVVRPATRPSLRARRGGATGFDEWLKPEPRIPCDDPEMRRVARSFTGGSSLLWESAQRIRRGVHAMMGVNAGIGVLRDAREVWSSKEGVCRDHAVLMATLLRASNIPTRLVSGLVYQDGALYYHAWVEVHDGHGWFGVDSTRASEFLTAGHVKTAQGHLGEATSGFLLPGAKFAFVRGER